MILYKRNNIKRIGNEIVVKIDIEKVTKIKIEKEEKKR